MKKMAVVILIGLCCIFSNGNFSEVSGKGLAPTVNKYVESPLVLYAYGPIRVNYDATIESLLELAQDIDWYDKRINSQNFSTKRRGEADLTFEIYHSTRELTSREVLKEMNELGCRPAELRELIVFEARYPGEWHHIAALGSLLEPKPSLSLGIEFRYVPASWSKYSWTHTRGIGLDVFDKVWPADYNFAVVRK